MPARLRGAAPDAAASSTACAYVGPLSPYANPFAAGDRSPTQAGPRMDAEEAVDLFAATLRGPVGRFYADEFARALRGLDLMCTCPLDVPCHADVLLRLANDHGDRNTNPTRNLMEGPPMPHPIMLSAAEQLTAGEKRRTTAREDAFRTWGPRSTYAAARYARRLLGAEAATLEWQTLGLLSFEEHLQAFASLDTVGGQHLELYYSDQDGTDSITLRVSCMSCPSQRVHEVTSLEQLGQLLSQTPAWSFITPRDGGKL
ncbi:hypothetical protein GCM10009665_06530 [Kitasatospora nipponensis]|uniref:DUF4326 domain-containing protein n=1 Tax=Kitasatospora nipponensis TaxID=258049 RepID=A0ABN1VS23_9ACTN